MNLAQLLFAVLMLAVLMTGLRLRKSRSAGPSTTNLLLVGFGGLLGFFAYQHVQSENHEATRTMDYSRCWNGDCKREISARW